MCEILVRRIHKPGGTTVGDVITVVDDDHRWGRMELGAPQWVVVKCPGLSVAEFGHMTQPLFHNGVLLHLRAKRLLIDDAALFTKDFVTIARDKVLAMVVAKPLPGVETL